VIRIRARFGARVVRLSIESQTNLTLCDANTRIHFLNILAMQYRWIVI
jgi:hypothetical protein